jgi:hypothetical protein
MNDSFPSKNRPAGETEMAILLENTTQVCSENPGETDNGLAPV